MGEKRWMMMMMLLHLVCTFKYGKGKVVSHTQTDISTWELSTSLKALLPSVSVVCVCVYLCGNLLRLKVQQCLPMRATLNLFSYIRA